MPKNAPSRKKSLGNYSKKGGMTAKGVASYRRSNLLVIEDQIPVVN